MGRDAQMRTGVLALVFTLSLGACATVPLGPSVMVLPGTGKSFDQFQADDAVCRQWASVQTGTTPQQAAGSSTAKSGVLGTNTGAWRGVPSGFDGPIDAVKGCRRPRGRARGRPPNPTKVSPSEGSRHERDAKHRDRGAHRARAEPALVVEPQH